MAVKVTPIPTYEKFEVIFKKPPLRSKDLSYGDVTQVQKGDTVSYLDTSQARASGGVEKVNTAAGKLRVAPHTYNSYILRPGRTLDFKEILEVLRPKAGIEAEASSGSPREGCE
jgi:hypothetical protein